MDEGPGGQEPTPGDGTPLEPRQQSLLRSSLLMASGTLLSRILGFVRSALLIAAIGAFAGTAASFQVANTLPNMVYNLLAAGILDAILVPQIVRALRERSDSPYVNKLITAVGSILFLLTGLAMIATPLLISMLAPALTGEARSLTITFSLWCVPQIFFYGLYNLFGQVLNARGVFGPYMWAPVLNNVIGILSLGAFILMWGPAGEVLPVETFTGPQVLVLAGLSTVGVIAQAVVLLLPMKHAGVKLRIDFRLKGTNFGSASSVAFWTFATLMVSQVGVISTTNLATRADAFTNATGEVVAGFTAYSYAFMIFMVPQSLITVTLVTAIFTRIANDVADGDFKGVARNYHQGLKLVVMLCLASAGILMVTATPFMQLIMPNLQPESASLYGAVLVALMLGVPATGINMMSQRVFFALENAKPVFLIGIIPTIVQLIVAWSIYAVASAEWWTIGAATSETVSRLTQAFISLYWVSRVVTQISFTKMIRTFSKSFVAFIISALIGWGVMTLLGPGSDADSGAGRFFDSVWKISVVALVILLVFFTVLRFLDPAGFNSASAAFLARIRPRSSGPGDVVLPAGEEVLSEDAALEDLLGHEPAGQTEPDPIPPSAPPSPRFPRRRPVGTPEPRLPSRSSAHRENGSRNDRQIPRGRRRRKSEGNQWADAPPTWDEIFESGNAGLAATRSYTMPELSATGPVPTFDASAAGARDNLDDLAEWINDLLADPDESDGPDDFVG